MFNSGIRPAIDEYLKKKSEEKRDYGQYWSASSGGYCMRKLVFERLGVPPVEKDGDERKTRVFEAGKIFHTWVQEITKNASLSIAQELELQDEELMVRGHIDDLVLIGRNTAVNGGKLILYDYKTQHSGAFTWQKDRPISYYHRLQVGTYMYMLRKYKVAGSDVWFGEEDNHVYARDLSEARILKISKDDLRMNENQVLWDDQLEADVMDYWVALNGYWKDRKMPDCTCADVEGGFMAKEKFNPFWFEGEPCSLRYYHEWQIIKEKETV